MRKKLNLILIIVLVYIVTDLCCYKTSYTHLYLEVFKQVSKNQYTIHVDLDDNTMYIFKNKVLVKKYPVSGGKSSTPSPLGTWTIVSKDVWGEGFGGTWMGFNVPWGKFGIHGTDEPWSIGNDLSHGCIRMFNKDAEAVRKLIPVGTKVTIVKGTYGPFGSYFRVLKPGYTGSDVFAIEKRLQRLGYYNGWVKGIYDDGLKSAIHKFQKAKGLPISDSVNLNTYKAMGFIPFE